MVKKKTAKKARAAKSSDSKGIFSVVLFALGLYFIIEGFSLHMTDLLKFWDWWAFLNYLVGIIFFKLAHSCKNSAC